MTRQFNLKPSDDRSHPIKTGRQGECEAFCEVRVLTFCVMSNHFHLLVEVPKRPEKLPGVEEVLADAAHEN